MSDLSWVIAALGLAALAIQLVLISCTLYLFSLRGRCAALDASGVSGFELPSVALLKPLKGLEENLEANLRSFFEQDYRGRFELVFTSTDPYDPAVFVARRVAREYARVRVKFVRASESLTTNPKVAGLSAALAATSADYVLQSDANVWASPSFVRSSVSDALRLNAALVSAPILATGERSFGAALENTQLCSGILPAVSGAFLILDHPCVVGKAVLIDRVILNQLGGFAAVRRYLCEDHMLGLRFRRAGYRVAIGLQPVFNVNIRLSVGAFFARHARWLKMRAVIHRPAFWVEILTNPVTTLGLAFALAHWSSGAVLWALGFWALRLGLDWSLTGVLRRERLPYWSLPALLLKDVLLFFAWWGALFSRRVVWRGNEVRFGRHSRIQSCQPLRPKAKETRTVSLGWSPFRRRYVHTHFEAVNAALEPAERSSVARAASEPLA